MLPRAFLFVAVPLLVDLVYAAQIYSLYLSGNFITVLGIENRAESRIIRNSSLYAALAVAIAWWLLFLAGLSARRRRGRRKSQWRRSAVSLPSGGFSVAARSCCWRSSWPDRTREDTGPRSKPTIARLRSSPFAHRLQQRDHETGSSYPDSVQPVLAPGTAGRACARNSRWRRHTIYSGAAPLRAEGATPDEAHECHRDIYRGYFGTTSRCLRRQISGTYAKHGSFGTRVHACGQLLQPHRGRRTGVCRDK